MEKKAKKQAIGNASHEKGFFSFIPIHNKNTQIKENTNEWLYENGVPLTG